MRNSCSGTCRLVLARQRRARSLPGGVLPLGCGAAITARSPPLTRGSVYSIFYYISITRSRAKRTVRERTVFVIS